MHCIALTLEYLPKVFNISAQQLRSYIEEKLFSTLNVCITKKYYFSCCIHFTVLMSHRVNDLIQIIFTRKNANSQNDVTFFIPFPILTSWLSSMRASAYLLQYPLHEPS